MDDLADRKAAKRSRRKKALGAETERFGGPRGDDAADVVAAWEQFTAPDGRAYFYNQITRESRWKLPKALRKRQSAMTENAAPSDGATSAAVVGCPATTSATTTYQADATPTTEERPKRDASTSHGRSDLVARLQASLAGKINPLAVGPPPMIKIHRVDRPDGHSAAPSSAMTEASPPSVPSSTTDIDAELEAETAGMSAAERLRFLRRRRQEKRVEEDDFMKEFAVNMQRKEEERAKRMTVEEREREKREAEQRQREAEEAARREKTHAEEARRRQEREAAEAEEARQRQERAEQEAKERAAREAQEAAKEKKEAQEQATQERAVLEAQEAAEEKARARAEHKARKRAERAAQEVVTAAIEEKEAEHREQEDRDQSEPAPQSQSQSSPERGVDISAGEELDKAESRRRHEGRHRRRQEQRDERRSGATGGLTGGIHDNDREVSDDSSSQHHERRKSRRTKRDVPRREADSPREQEGDEGSVGLTNTREQLQRVSISEEPVDGSTDPSTRSHRRAKKKQSRRHSERNDQSDDDPVPHGASRRASAPSPAVCDCPHCAGAHHHLGYSYLPPPPPTQGYAHPPPPFGAVAPPPFSIMYPTPYGGGYYPMGLPPPPPPPPMMLPMYPPPPPPSMAMTLGAPVFQGMIPLPAAQLPIDASIAGALIPMPGQPGGGTVPILSQCEKCGGRGVGVAEKNGLCAHCNRLRLDFIVASAQMRTRCADCGGWGLGLVRKGGLCAHCMRLRNGPGSSSPGPAWPVQLRQSSALGRVEWDASSSSSEAAKEEEEEDWDD